MNRNAFTMKSSMQKTTARAGVMRGLPAFVGAALILVVALAAAIDLPGFTPMPNTQMCSSTPPKCIEKSPEDLRYERILEALKKMEGGERIYSQTATPANEPASYGPSQMTIDAILNGLIAHGGASHTFTAESGTKYTLTKKDLTDAIERGMASGRYGDKTTGNFLGYAETNNNDYKDISTPARNKTVDGYFTASGLPSGEWGTWWERAVAYAKLQKLVDELKKEYLLVTTVVKDDKGKVMTKTKTVGSATENIPEAFYTFVDKKGNILGATPAVTYGKRLDELLALAFPHVTTDRRVAFRPYIRLKIWQEGRYSFYNRAAYSHPTIPYADFKEGIARWFDATPQAEEANIRASISAAAKNRGKAEGTLHPDKDEEEIARYTASKHNSGDFKAIKGTYAEKLVEHWKTIKWNFKCGTDPRTKPSPKEAQA